MAWWEMAWRGSLATAAMRHRMDAALVGVLLAGSLGFDDGATWLEPGGAPNGAGKAFVVIAPRQAPAHAAPVILPHLAYAGAPFAGPGAGPRFAVSATQPGGNGFAADNRPGGGLAPGPQAGPRLAAALPNALVFGNGPAQLNGGYTAGHSASAVPEPSTWALVGLGMAMAAGMARRRRRLPA